MKKIKLKVKYFILDFIVKRFSKKRIYDRILNEKEKKALGHIESGFLKDMGWWNSWEQKAPLDKDNNPLPWVTYSFISFITSRLHCDMSVFEFGSGNSTLFYSKKVKSVDTVEHDNEWYNKLKVNLPNNVKIYNENLEYGGKYCKTAINTKKKFDIIIIDGRDRVNSMINSVNALSDLGVLVLDDSERDIYKKGIDYVLELGFKKIDFWGISPGFISYNKCTSIYYKTNNVLNI